MAQVEQILNVRVDVGEAIRSITELQAQQSKLKYDQEALQKAVDEGKIGWAEYRKEMELNKTAQRSITEQIRVLRKEVDNEVKANQQAEGSLKGMRAELSNATKAFDELSRAEREGAQGEELRNKINKLTAEIKAAEYETQRFQRNVGNYPQTFSSVLGIFKSTALTTGSMTTAFKAATTATMALGKQLLTLAMNPIGAVISAIGVVVIALTKAFKDNEEASNRLSMLFAKFEPIMNIVKRAFDAVIDVIITFIENVVAAITAVTDFFGLTDSSVASAEETLTKREQNLVQAKRKFTQEEAELERDIAMLRDKSADKEKYTLQERLAALEEAQQKERELAKKRKEQAQEEAEIISARNKLSASSKEELDAEAEAWANVARAEQEYYQADRKLTRERNTLLAQERAEQEAQRKAEEEERKRRAQEAKRRADEALRLRRQQAKDEQSLTREAEDALIAIIKDAYTQQQAVLKAQYERKTQDLRARLETDNTLTAQAREAINTQLLALEAKYNADREALEKASTDKAIKERAELNARLIERDVAANLERLQLEAQALEKNSAERLAKEQELAEAERQQALASAQKKHEDELRAIEESQLTEQEKQAAELEALRIFEEEKANLDLEYKNRATERNKAYNDAVAKQNEETAKKEQALLQARLSVASSVFGGLSKIVEQFGDEQSAFTKLSKMLALAEIAINTGKAIAAGVAQAQSVPFPANIAAIATTIGTIMGNIATAVSTVKSAKFATGVIGVEKRATGGVITGAGSGTSDSIPAMLSNGESVITAAATRMFAPALSAFNVAGGGVAIQGGNNLGEDMLARAFARGASTLPNPVVSVAEINDVQNRVVTLENLASV